MTNGDIQFQTVSQLFLELRLPQAQAISIAATAVTQDQDRRCVGEVELSNLLPPACQNVHSKLGRIGRFANVHIATIAIEHVNAIGNCPSKRVQLEIVVVHALSFQTPALSWVLIVANQLLSLGINADNWPTVAQKELLLRLDILELGVAVWMLSTCLTFDIGFERIIHRLQQSAYCFGTGRMSFCLQPGAQMAQTAAQPFFITHRIACGFSFNQFLQNSLYRRVFFSTAGRPPPAKRTCSTGRCAKFCSSSCCPR